MRTLLAWFNARRRLTGLALLGLVAVVYLSAGRTPRSGEWVRIPDLGSVLAFVLGGAAILGLVFLGFARPGISSRSPGEVRSLRALLVLAFVVVASVLWFGPEETVEDAPIVEQEETVTPANEGPGTTEVADPVTASGPDIVVLALILLVIAADVVRRWRNSPRPPADAEPPTDVMLSGELGSAFEEAHHHLSEETDPRTAVLMAYASLERALADVDHDRNPAETPSEHLARAFANLPVSVTPAVRLGELYEIARFSREVITEQDRQEATRALDRARSSLVLAESGRS